MICSAGCNVWQKNDNLEEPLCLFFFIDQTYWANKRPLDSHSIISKEIGAYFFLLSKRKKTEQMIWLAGYNVWIGKKV